MWKSLHRFASLGLKSRITARWRSFPRKTMQRFPSLGLKSRIAAVTRAFPGKTMQRFPSLGSKSRIEAVASPFCRRNHFSLRRRRLESDAEDRCRHGRYRRNHSSLPQQKLESAQISAKFLNAFRANHSKIHKYLQYSQNLTGGRNELENQSEILILLQFIGKHL